MILSNGQVASSPRHCATRFRTLMMALTTLLLAASAMAQPPDTYRMYTSKESPGMVGKRQVAYGRVPAGLVQPVRITAPAGTVVSPADNGSYADDYFAPAEYGLKVGEIYRFRLSDIPRLGDKAIYPSIEMIGHLNPPEGKAREFPIPIVFTIEDLTIAAQGGLVTRVVYVEDPDGALPGMLEEDDQSYFEVSRGEDPLHIAEVLGRPVAILRIGSKSPDPNSLDHNFAFQSPSVERYSTNQTLYHDLGNTAQTRTRSGAVRPASYGPQPARRKYGAAPVLDMNRLLRSTGNNGGRKPPVPFAPARKQNRSLQR